MCDSVGWESVVVVGWTGSLCDVCVLVVKEMILTCDNDTIHPNDFLDFVGEMDEVRTVLCFRVWSYR